VRGYCAVIACAASAFCLVHTPSLENFNVICIRLHLFSIIVSARLFEYCFPVASQAYHLNFELLLMGHDYLLIIASAV